MMNRATLGLLAAAALYAQRPDPNVTFEVASVKAPPPRVLNGPTRMGCTGGPGSSDPGRFTCTNGMPMELLRLAFDLKPYQLAASNLPGISSGFSIRVGETYQHGFDIEARIPAGTTPEQFRTMLQNLLIDRFKLAYHFEKKDSDAYDLVIAKNSPKLKEVAPQPDPSPAEQTPPSGSAGRPKTGENGCPIPTKQRGTVSMLMGTGSGVCAGGTAAPISALARYLSGVVGHTVDDATGLKGLFDVSLAYSPNSLQARPVGDVALPDDNSIGGFADIFTAIQQQLGLRLEKKKGSIDFFFVDHIEKVPTEN